MTTKYADFEEFFCCPTCGKNHSTMRDAFCCCPIKCGYTCSVCDSNIHSNGGEPEECPHCGAKAHPDTDTDTELIWG